jgi:hypothetical protein
VTALEGIWLGRDRTFRGDILANLIPYLSTNLLEEAFRRSIANLRFDLHEALVAILQHLPSAYLAGLFPAVLEMPDAYARTKALRAMTPYMTPDVLERTLAYSLRTKDDYHASDTISDIGPHLSEEQLRTALESSLAWNGYSRQLWLSALAPHLTADLMGRAIEAARNTKDGTSRAEILTSLAPSLPGELLSEALELVTEITEMERRGGVLAKMLPRLREAGISTSVTDAYRVAFTIGDGSFRALAQAALIPYLDADYLRRSVTELSAGVDAGVRDREEYAIFLHILALALVHAHAPDTKARNMLGQAAALAHDIHEQPMRALALGVLAARLPPEYSSQLKSEVVELARMNPEEGLANLLALLAARSPEEDIRLFLEQAETLKALCSNEKDKAPVDGIIRIVSALTKGMAVQQMIATVAEALKTTGIADNPEEIKLLSLLLVLLFSPKMESRQVDELIRDTLAALRHVDDPTLRVISPALIVAYLPSPLLTDYTMELLEICAQRDRPMLFVILAIMQGLLAELFQGKPTVAGNRILGSPLVRLGGAVAVQETEDAIRDISCWWP